MPSVRKDDFLSSVSFLLILKSGWVTFNDFRIIKCYFILCKITTFNWWLVNFNLLHWLSAIISIYRSLRQYLIIGGVEVWERKRLRRIAITIEIVNSHSIKGGLFVTLIRVCLRSRKIGLIKTAYKCIKWDFVRSFTISTLILIMSLVILTTFFFFFLFCCCLKRLQLLQIKRQVRECSNGETFREICFRMENSHMEKEKSMQDKYCGCHTHILYADMNIFMQCEEKEILRIFAVSVKHKTKAKKLVSIFKCMSWSFD